MAGTKVASGNSFVATIDALKAELGDERWITVSGISATLKSDPKPQGGTPTHEQYVFSGLTYSDLTLTRAVDDKSSKLINWFAGHALKVIPGTGSVRIFTPDGKVLHTFSFSNLVPVSYKGPELGMDKGGSVVTESVTFKHHGFADSLNGTSAAAAPSGASTI